MLSTISEWLAATDRETITRIVGVLITATGVLLATPAGTATAVSTVTSTVARSLRRKTREPAALSGTVGIISATLGSMSGTAMGTVGEAPPLTPDMRIDLLTERIDGLETRVSDDAILAAGATALVAADLDKVEAAHADAIAALDARVAAAETEAARVDAQALPIVLLGVAVGAAEPLLSALPPWAWSSCIVASLAATVVVATRVRRAHMNRRL